MANSPPRQIILSAGRQWSLPVSSETGRVAKKLGSRSSRRPLIFTRDKLAYQPLALPARPVLDDAAMAAAATAYDAAMATRHTVRDFTDRPVPRAIVETCIRTATLALSGANHQPWHFSLIGDAAMKAEIRAAAEPE